MGSNEISKTIFTSKLLNSNAQVPCNIMIIILVTIFEPGLYIYIYIYATGHIFMDIKKLSDQ